LNNSSLIAVAVYNEAKHLPNLLMQLFTHRSDVVIIDDGSSDSSAEIALSQGFEVVKLTSNAGLAAVYRAAFSYASNRNYKQVIFIDGDGQHDPVSIPKFKLLLEENHFVSGSRFADPENVPEAKIASNLFAVLLIASSMHIYLPDVACGFRGFQHNGSLPSIEGAQGYEVIYSTLLDQLSRGVTPQYVKMSAFYPLQEIYYTRISELIGLLNAVSKHDSNALISEIRSFVSDQKDFNIQLESFDFSAKHTRDGYIFHTDTTKAKQYFIALNKNW